MNDIDFHPIRIEDKDIIRSITAKAECRNCDFNFMNLMSWRFLYNTEMGVHAGWLLFRFYTEGHLAYLMPQGGEDWHEIIEWLMNDARKAGHPFLMLGVCQNSVALLDSVKPDFFHWSYDRNYCDYVYEREKLETLAGKKLQPKRNFVNRFIKAHPDYEFRPLTAAEVPLCRQLEQQWKEDRPINSDKHNYENERRSMDYVFDHWEELDAQGGTIFVDGRLVAFTFGAPINYDTYDVCVEKADASVEGAYAIINRDFVRSLPEQYIYVNREEDLGVEGLRHAKLSYHPTFLLEKNAVRLLRPLEDEKL